MISVRSKHAAWRWLLVAGCAATTPAQAMTLMEALQRSLEHDPAVAQSLALYDAEREAGRQERAALLPSVTATGRYLENDLKTESAFFGSFEERYESWGAGIEARQPLFRLDWFARGDRALAQDQLAEAGLAQRKMELLTRIAERYFTVLVAQSTVEQAEAEAAAVRKSLGDTRKRYDVDLVPGTDLKEAQARDDLAQAQRLIAERELEAARDALHEITGSGDSALPALQGDAKFPPLTPATVEAWVESTRKRNPGLLTAAEQLKVATADVRSRQSLAAPSLDAVGRYGRDDTSKSQIGQRADQGQVGVELTVPIYAGGINASLVREAKARTRAADANLRRLTAEAERQTRQLFRQVQTGYTEIAAYEQVLASAKAAQQATGYGYDAGTRTISDVLDAGSRTVEAQRNLSEARYRLLLSLLQLKQVSGSLSEQDFVEVDRLLAASAAMSQ
ncbi:MAG TPA: TolC family outer membrane protein [Solimonas sp.]